MIEEFIKLDQISVSGIFDKPFYPVYVDKWGNVAINVNEGLGSGGWLLMGGTATGPILANYQEDGNVFNLARKSYVDSKYQDKDTELSKYLKLTGGILDLPLLIDKEPETKDDAATFGYMSTLANSYLKTESFGTGTQQMKGPITLHSTLNTAYDVLNAVTRKYVEDKINETIASASMKLDKFVKLTGDTVEGHITVDPPVDMCDAVNLGFVQDYLAQKTIDFFSKS